MHMLILTSTPLCVMIALCLGTRMSYYCVELSVPLNEINYFLPRNVIVCCTFIFHVAATHHHHHHLHYSPLWVVAFSAKSLQVLLPLAVSFQFFIFSFFKSSMSSSCHHCLGLPTVLAPIGFQSNSFLVDLAWSILCIWPSRLILCALTLCRSNLQPYCMGRKAAFFSVGI